MIRKLTLVLAAATALTVAARAADPTVYENTLSPYYIFNSSAPAAVAGLDDGHLGTLGTPGGADITDFKFAFSTPNLGPGALVDFDALITFFGGTPPGTDFSAVKSPANTLATFRVQFRNVDASAVKLYASPTLAANFTIPTRDFAVEYLFVSPDGVDINDITDVAAPLLAAGPTTVGSNDDWMYTDDNYNGTYEAPPSTEGFGFGSPGLNMGIYLRLHGKDHDAIPEPGTLALLVAIAPLAGLVTRRKRA